MLFFAIVATAFGPSQSYWNGNFSVTRAPASTSAGHGHNNCGAALEGMTLNGCSGTWHTENGPTRPWRGAGTVICGPSGTLSLVANVAVAGWNGEFCHSVLSFSFNGDASGISFTGFNVDYPCEEGIQCAYSLTGIRVS